MASIDANLCSLSAEVRSFLSRTIEWPVMNVAADQDSTSNDSVQPEAVQACGPTPMGLRLYFQKRTSCQTRMDARAGFTTLFAGLRL